MGVDDRQARSAAFVRDKRDPTTLGNLLFVMAMLHGSVRAAYDRSSFHGVPDYRDETTIEKYGRPQSRPSKLPN